MSTAEGGRTATGSAGMKEIEAQVRTCQLCRLAKTRTNAVPGEGNIRAEVMFIGEGPGYHEDKQGRPFVGAAGQFLNELLEIAGLDRSSVYITNVVKCRPPNNRDPQPDEMDACSPYLERQIALINPKVIVTLGRFSMSRFFPNERISQIHGTARVVEGRMCVAMYHPAAGLHQASLADIIRADFRKVPVYLEQSRRLGTPPRRVEEERVQEAEEAQTAVVHEPETAAVLPQDRPERTLSGANNVISEAPAAEMQTQQATTPEAQAVEPVKPAPKANLRAGKRKAESKADKEQEKEYQQLSFF